MQETTVCSVCVCDVSLLTGKLEFYVAKMQSLTRWESLSALPTVTWQMCSEAKCTTAACSKLGLPFSPPPLSSRGVQCQPCWNHPSLSWYVSASHTSLSHTLLSLLELFLFLLKWVRIYCFKSLCALNCFYTQYFVMCNSVSGEEKQNILYSSPLCLLINPKGYFWAKGKSTERHLLCLQSINTTLSCCCKEE